MLNANAMSEAIRMKRKKIKEDGVENMIDTAPGPQMNPQDIHNLKMQAQIEETLDVPEKSEASSDPADARLDETQEESGLKKRAARTKKVFEKLSIG